MKIKVNFNDYHVTMTVDEDGRFIYKSSFRKYDKIDLYNMLIEKSEQDKIESIEMDYKDDDVRELAKELGFDIK